MNSQTINRLQHLCDTIPGILRKYSEKELSHKASAEKWSKKELLGHLIDSASNNHQRFVRAQFEDAPRIVYDQNQWNNASHYNDLDSHHLIAFWELYNRHLLEVVKRIPPEILQRKCNADASEPVTIAYLIDDYLRHMEHHLEQMIGKKLKTV